MLSGRRGIDWYVRIMKSSGTQTTINRICIRAEFVHSHRVFQIRLTNEMTIVLFVIPNFLLIFFFYFNTQTWSGDTQGIP